MRRIPHALIAANSRQRRSRKERCMKTVIVLLTSVWISLATSLAAAQQVERVTMVGGPPAGMFGIFATGISTYLSKTVPNLNVSVAATAGSVENLRRINGGEAEIGISFAGDIHEGFNGLEKFQGKPLTNVRAIGAVFMGVAHLVTYADSNIKTVEDLAGKRVAVGNPGSGTFATAERVFRSLNMWDRITRVPLLGAAAGDALSEGKADAYFWTGPSPDRVTMEAATKKPVRAIDVYTPVSKTDFFKQYPYFARYTFVPGSYRGITEEVHSVGSPALWIAHRDFSPALVQKMAATIYSGEGNAHMLKVHAGSKDMVPDKALQGITIPLHKGAEAHWQSARMAIPEGIRSR
jgi:TRAP transporter TAXI family solute receptor